MIQVRNVEHADARLLMQMILEMGQHERMPVTTTEQRLEEDGFGAIPRFHALIAEAASGIAGYALFFDYYSSFQGAGIFLEDLFVRKRFSRSGSWESLTVMHRGEGNGARLFWNHAQRSGLEPIGVAIL